MQPQTQNLVDDRMYPEIEMDELISDWKIARDYREKYTVDFPSLDRLVDGIPVNYQNKAPYVGDTTIAGLVRSIPRESIQQLPIFAAVVNGSKQSIHAAVCSYILRDCVFNENTFGKGVLSTTQLGAEQAIAHGYAPFITKTGNSIFDDFGTTMQALHYADVDPEPGIQDHNEAGFDYVVANLTKTRVRKLLKSAQNNPDTSWNVPLLEQLLEMDPSGNDYSAYEKAIRENMPNIQAPTYKFVTKYEVGKESEFVTFCPQVPDDALRVKTNRSKFGYPRITFLVIDPAPLSPFGVSRVRLASPGQNLMNAYYQNIASMLILNSKPPVLQRGRFLQPIKLKQGEVWKTQDPNAKAELMSMDNGALTQFVPMAKQMSAQIQNMMGKPTRNTDLGNTSPGAKQQIKYEDTSTNQITNILENFLRQYALVALDTYICEQTGEVVLIVDDECKNMVNRIAESEWEEAGALEEFVPPIGKDNKFTLVWEDFYEAIEKLSVEIELSIGKDEMEEKKLGDLQDMLTTLAQTADPNDMEAQQKIKELRDRLLEKTVPESSRMSPKPPVAPFTTPQPTVETQSPNQVTTNAPV